MGLIVQKYGGTSVGTPERIKRVAQRIIQRKKAGNQLVATVSAMGDRTDQLVNLANQVSDNPPQREYDMLLSTGEQESVALLAMAINSLGEEVVSLTGSQAGITTNDLHTKAEILNINPERIETELAEDKIVIIAGFQGMTNKGDITTLGRGGSDTTAVAIATSLRADLCEIYTDVDGVYTADPRIVEDAAKIKEISYDEMLELASLGANVLHPRSVEIAKDNKIELMVKSSFCCIPGTYIKEENKLEDKLLVSGVTCDKDQVKLSLIGVPDQPGIASNIFTKLAKSCINVDMIIQNVDYDELNDITFTVSKDDFLAAKEILESMEDDLDYTELKSDDTLSKVSIVGAGMVTNPGVAARMFTALGANDVNIEMISTSEIKVSCLINAEDSDRAIRAIHQEFNLSEQDD